MAKKPEEQVDTHRFTRRAVVLGALQVGAFGLLTSRLYQLQVVDAAQYTTLAEENRINYQLVAPPRGYIYDRFGHVVASNRDNLKIIIVPEDAGDLDALLERLHLIAPLETKERDVAAAPRAAATGLRAADREGASDLGAVRPAQRQGAGLSRCQAGSGAFQALSLRARTGTCGRLCRAGQRLGGRERSHRS